MPELRSALITEANKLYPGANIQQRVNLAADRPDQTEPCKAILVLEDDLERIGRAYQRAGVRVHLASGDVATSPVEPPLNPSEPEEAVEVASVEGGEVTLTDLTPPISGTNVAPPEPEPVKPAKTPPAKRKAPAK